MLLVILNEAMGLFSSAFLTSQLADMMVSPWVGLKKDYRNQLQWINNDDVTYTNFGYGEPNGGGKEKCVQVTHYY